MDLQFFVVPYDSGHRNIRMGKGPQHLLNTLLPVLSKEHSVAVVTIEPDQGLAAEIKTSFSLNEHLANQLKQRGESKFPVILSGNCGTALGTIAGLSTEDLGVVWFDAHADFNTPDTTQSGFLDGMGLATLAGLCWKRLAGSLDGFKPIAGNRMLLVGTRSYSEAEKSLMNSVGATSIPAEDIKTQRMETLLPNLERLHQSGRTIYLHIDLDVIDPAIAIANEFAPGGGLSVEQLLQAVRLIRKMFTVKALGIASYDPAFDRHNVFPEMVWKVIESLCPGACPHIPNQ